MEKKSVFLPYSADGSATDFEQRIRYIFNEKNTEKYNIHIEGIVGHGTNIEANPYEGRVDLVRLLEDGLEVITGIKEEHGEFASVIISHKRKLAFAFGYTLPGYADENFDEFDADAISLETGMP